MVNIFTPKKDADEQIFFPFGPVMGYKKLSPEFVKNMNSFYEEEPDLQDYSDNLVGKVGQELHFNEAMRDLFLNEVKDFIGRYNQTATIRNSYGRNRLNTDNFEYSMQFVSGWLVRQFEHEYNPTHWHNGHISGAGFLKVPKNFGDYSQKNQKIGKEYVGGNLNLIHGSKMFLSESLISLRPEVGDFYFFPNYLMHTVYPFKNTNEERRSISFNGIIDESIHDIYFG